jgi:predicted DNA-binding protein with PD1-like motif
MKFPLGSSKTRVLSAAGSFSRVVVARFRPGTDLITGIRVACRRHKIRGGVVLGAFGSLQKCVLGYVRPSPEPHMKSSLDWIRLSGPIEFASAQGTISESDKGELVIHLHGVVADRHNHCFAGHFIEGQNLTLANLEVTIGEITGAKMGRVMEPELGWELLSP